MSRFNRTFRVFVSSTFSDLVKERNALQAYVFPRLSELARQHDCRFQAIDLRWGISEEATLDQQTMRICLEEIKRCQQVSPRPNFIVLLGNRYGWRPLPESIPADEFNLLQATAPFTDPDRLALLEAWYVLDENAEPPTYFLKPRLTGTPLENRTTWEEQVEFPLVAALALAASSVLSGPALLKYTASATSREINDGVFSMPDAREHVFGYFRSISNRQAVLTSDKAGIYFDCPSGKFNQELYDRQQTLKADLKARLPGNCHEMTAAWQDGALTTAHIGSLPGNLSDCLSLKDSDCPVTNLCQAVWLDLARIMLAEIEKMDDPGSPEFERLVHHQCAERVSTSFVGRSVELAELLDYCAAPQSLPIVVWGQAGSGKSALLAEAATRLEKTSSGRAVIISRFIGATAASSTAPLLLQSLYQQICAAYQVEQSAGASDYPALVQEFQASLAFSTPQRPLILILDGLEHIAGPDLTVQSTGLAWFPLRLPPNTSLVASLTPGDALRYISSRLGEDGPVLQKNTSRAQFLYLDGLTVEEGARLLDLWLGAAHRRLTDSQRQSVLGAFSHSRSPGYLKLAFDQARRWVSYHTYPDLPEDMSRLTLFILNNLVLPQNHGVELVTHTLEYLSAARYGLSEDELLDVLFQDKKVKPELLDNAKYYPDITAVPVSVWVRLLTDLQPFLSEFSSGGLALMRWSGLVLPDEVDATTARHELVKYFDRQSFNRRQAEELPWLLHRLEKWPELAQLLVNELFFSLAWRYFSCDIRTFWRELEQQGYPLEKAYTPILNHPGKNPDLAWQVAELLMERGKWGFARDLLTHLEERFRFMLDEPRLAAVKQKMANAFYQTGDLGEAIRLYEQVAEMGERVNAPHISQAARIQQAAALCDLGLVEQARELLLRQEALCRQSGNQSNLQAALAGLAQLDLKQGNWARALALLQEQEQICNFLGDWGGLQAAWGNQARVYRLSDPERALDLFKKQLQLSKKTANLKGEAAALNNLSLLCQDAGKFSRAFELLVEAEKVCLEMQSPPLLIQIWIHQAGLLASRLARPDLGLEKVLKARDMAAQLGLTHLEEAARHLVEKIGRLTISPHPPGGQ